MKRQAKRNITPRTQEFLKLHKEAYESALKDPDKASRAVVQAMDQVYHSTAFLLRPHSTDEYEKVMQYIKLRRLEIIANYDDYVGQELQEIRAKLKKAVAADDPDVRKAALELESSKT